MAEEQLWNEIKILWLKPLFEGALDHNRINKHKMMMYTKIYNYTACSDMRFKRGEKCEILAKKLSDFLYHFQDLSFDPEFKKILLAPFHDVFKHTGIIFTSSSSGPSIEDLKRTIVLYKVHSRQYIEEENCVSKLPPDVVLELGSYLLTKHIFEKCMAGLYE